MSDTPVSLLERARLRTDAAAWDRLVSLYTPLLRGWLVRGALQPPDADDLVQEVLAVLVRELPSFRHDGRPGAFRRWLRTTLIHRLRDFARRRQRAPRSLDPDDLLSRVEQLESPDSDLGRLWDAEHDRHVVARLLDMIRPDFTAATWEAFRRQALEGAPAAQVAAELGLSANAV